MTEKHTQGPWRIGSCGPNGCHTVGTEKGLMVAMVAHSVNHPGQKDQAIGDANLIAAAPDLLYALKYARRNVNASECDIGFIDAAIKKAEGKT